MLKRIVMKSALLGMFVFSLAMIPACTRSTAEPVALTGDDTAAAPTHERHATGVGSQTRDY